jgi:hypothetical protein
VLHTAGSNRSGELGIVASDSGVRAVGCLLEQPAELDVGVPLGLGGVFEADLPLGQRIAPPYTLARHGPLGSCST